MIDVSIFGSTACLLLAAGRSERFGAGNKLSQPLNGRALGLHAASTLAAFPFAAHIVVTQLDGPDFAGAGFRSIPTDQSDAGQSHSLKLGLAEIIELPVTACLIALGDMPFIDAAHISALVRVFDRRTVASTCGEGPMPPALFPREMFAALMTLEGDRGARALLAGADLLEASARCLADFDNPDDWARWA